MKIKKNKPKGWTEVKLGQCLVVKHGKNQKFVEIPEGKYPILATGGQIGKTNTPAYSKPSVLIGRKGTIDKPQYIDKPFWTVDTLFYTEIKDGFSPKFLYFYFLTINWRLYNEGSGIPSLSASTISNIKIIVPNFPEQNRIVSVLETWDKIIESLKQKIEIKKEIKKVLVYRLLGGEIRLKGFSDRWELKTLEDMAGSKDLIVDGPFGSNLKNSDYVESGVPVLQGLNITGDKFNNKGFRYITKEKASNLSRSNARVGDLLTVKIGSVGFSAVIDKINNHDYAIIPANLIRLRCNNASTNLDFIYYLLTSQFGKSRLSKLASGNAQPAISLKNFRKLSFLVPKTKEEQDMIVNILKNTDKEIEKIEKKLAIIKDQKTYLLNNLLTGKIRTPETLSLTK